MSIDFIIISIIMIICLTYLISYTFNIPIPYILPNNLDYNNNLNTIIVSITTSYLVSYIVYILTIHIQNYKNTLLNERIICHYLSNYKYNLLYSFGGLTLKLKNENKNKKFNIPEITRLLESTEKKDTIIVNTIKYYDNNSLIRSFEDLDNSFKQIQSLNALYKTRFSKDIYYLQINSWTDIIFIIKDEILHEYQDFRNLEDEKVLDLINRNFEITNDAIKFCKKISKE